MSYPGDKYYIDKVIKGNRNAFAGLVEKYQDKVYTLSLKICNRPEDAEEVAQDSFMKAFKSLSSFKGNSSFSTWLYRITYNTAISCVRKKNYKVLKIEDFPADASDFLMDDGSEDFAEMEFRKTLLSFALQKLSADDRAIISLHYLQGLSLDEIMDIVKLSKSNLKVRLHRARKKMEETLLANISVTKEEIYEKV
jgi:RNA polymerase sigma factor (sigma-70 family)